MLEKIFRILVCHSITLILAFCAMMAQNMKATLAFSILSVVMVIITTILVLKISNQTRT
ncbi:MAG: hypothetical protein WCV85_04280 [Patescibacteria group bacterium]